MLYLYGTRAGNVVIIIFTQFVNKRCVNPVFIQELSCSLSCIDTITDSIEATGQVKGFFFSIIMNSKDDITKGWQVEVRCFKSFVERFSRVASVPITSPVDFISGPRRLSTLANFVNEKTGAFDMDMVTFWVKTIFVTFAQPMIYQRIKFVAT